MTNARELTLRDIYQARARLMGHILATPLRYSEWLSALTGAHVLLKLESLQQTNSFKLRGAMNAVLRVLEQQGKRSIVTASAGNHGRATALAAQRLGAQAFVFTPATAPETKKAAIRQSGAVLDDEAPDYDSAERRAREYARATEGVFISPYNHPDVIAGAGTIALDILESSPDVDTVVVPLGGGGLASGVALAVKSAAPHVSVVGVEVEASRPFAAALKHGRITHVDVGPSLADGLVGNLEDGSMTFPLVQRYVDRVMSVTEVQLRRAMRGLTEHEHLVVEGAGATATAALLVDGVVRPHARVAVLVTGSNIDLSRLREVLDGDSPASDGEAQQT
jgi:threonine dehydratase